MNSLSRTASRRTFLRRAISASLAAGFVAGRPGLLMAQDQACAPQEMPRTLVNVMLQGGADPRFVVRRMLRMASEDISRARASGRKSMTLRCDVFAARTSVLTGVGLMPTARKAAIARGIEETVDDRYIQSRVQQTQHLGHRKQAFDPRAIGQDHLVGCHKKMGDR